MNEEMKSARAVSDLSPDPDTKVGVILKNSEGEILVRVCNEPPDGVQLNPARIVRPLKYKYIEHAERRAIYIAARNGWATEGGTMYSTVFPCTDCARALVQAGIKTVVVPINHALKDRKEYKDEFAIAKVILKGGGVSVMWLEE